MIITLDYVTENPWLLILILLLVFGAIVLAVILVKKYSPQFKNEEKPKTDEEIAKDEVDRLTVPMDEGDKSLDEVRKVEAETKTVKEPAPNREEAANYESHRATVEGDEEFQKQMDEYSKTHPAEVPVNLDSEEKDKK